MRNSEFGNIYRKLKGKSIVIKLQYPCYIYDEHHNLIKIIDEKIVNTRDSVYNNNELWADKGRILTEGKVNT